MGILEKMEKAYGELKGYSSFLDAYDRVSSKKGDIDWLVRVAFSFGWQQGEESVREEMQKSQRVDGL
ncbi:MAG: hypothetical protein LBI19_02530 [Oscillospiraceae bacterium]|jgi:hypothetical protein|nr:hypothetical protein [Oscillospiraceae bacterium]